MMNLETYQHLVCQRDENAKVTTEKKQKSNDCQQLVKKEGTGKAMLVEDAMTTARLLRL